ncbi:hypothetical protein ASPZODRAFT_120248 [Penicilliopsis zonata CBS 506.65]|uniref:RNA polymerase II assembly factor Rtp1 C-terminal domain-containing protein n=1 Tax=Penicilliopsis zonata CBS 506.65 TaxID=1073090 RepID=A0A1L9SCJ0_9EURO|nr:hypothetical protein ASPZODRAFT_120248 [Penicilliopsis zonata CBS 506.65]OJJ44930.1 hypothetical protein ASPZODRAFT_120248 [Penicilliopsis zonata CBS 506.65]
MGDPRVIKEAFEAAGSFLDPVLKREEIKKYSGCSLLDILSKNLSDVTQSRPSAQDAVISQALELLTAIHIGFTEPVDSIEAYYAGDTTSENPDLEDARRRRVLHALLDLISLEGIYPLLSSGVGIPLQSRVISVLPAGVIAKNPQTVPSSKSSDRPLLDKILKALLAILFDARPSIQPVIRGRILSDLISGTSELAFNSQDISPSEQGFYHESFRRIVDDTPSPVLLPTLSAFLQSDTAPWFKSVISGQLSRIPLRQDGVLQTIFFVASQLAPGLGQEAQTEPSNGPHFTVQTIMQISKLLSSVPQDIDPVSYFTGIAPQLLALIDGPDPDLKRTAAYVVGNGILGKRAYGAVGTIGHSIFVDPIFKSLAAGLDDHSKFWMDRFDVLDSSGTDARADIKLPPPQDRVIVPAHILILAVERLGTLTLQHPNPGLVKRLVYPVLLPLWGLACYTIESQNSDLHQSVWRLLQTYFSISVGEQPLRKIAENLLWNGGATWTYMSDTTGVFLGKREGSESNQSNLVQLMDSLEGRATLFVKLLGSDPRSEELTADIFLHVSQAWLVQPQVAKQPSNLLRLPEDENYENIIQKLVSAKITEKLLGSFKDTLSRHPLKVLELAKQVIDSELNRLKAHQIRTQNGTSGKVSLSSLGTIVPNEENDLSSTKTDKDSAESLSAVFSLLSTVLASPEFAVNDEIQPTLENIKLHLDQLILLLPPSLSKPATTSSMFLEIHLTSPKTLPDTKKPIRNVSDIDTHRQALANINSDLPPVQAEGLTLLSGLIKRGSPVLDIPATLVLLISIITEPVSETAANEEFIYLNAVKLVGELASRHPRTTVKTLVEQYSDKSEERTLDQRLKIGEALLRTVQDLGDALTGESAKILGEGMIAVAGRRGHKPKARSDRKQQLEKERREEERQSRKEKELPVPPGWTISSTAHNDQEPTNTIEPENDESREVESAEQTAHSANILAAWAAGAASDEEPDDLRVRSSAISILATAVQTNIAGLGALVASSSLDLALSTLVQEPDPESAILRRASVVLLLDILQALDRSRENGKDTALGFGLSLTEDENIAAKDGGQTIGSIPRILRTLGFVEGRETDALVRGHIRVLVESLEAWTEKALLWGIGARGQHAEDFEPRLELGERIAGLDINPLSGDGSGRPRIEEIE